MVYFVIAILAFALSSYGWGRTIYKYIYPEERCFHAYCISLGLAVLIFWGGILNIFNSALPLSLYILFFSGLILSFFFLVQWHRRAKEIFKSIIFQNFDLLLVYVIPLIVFVFLIANLIPTYVMNYFDDYSAYIKYPVRMLQTGTLAGTPFENYGLLSLGGQSFLQAFIITKFPISYLNGFDSIFCMVLCLTLLIELADMLRVSRVITSASLLAFISINPFIVNLSAVYSGSLIFIALFVSLLMHSNALSAKQSLKNILIQSIPIALLLSAVITLKTTFIIFAGFLLLFFLILSIGFHKNKKTILTSGLFTTCLSIIFLIPWVILSLPTWGKMFLNLLTPKTHTPGIWLRTSLAPFFSYTEFEGFINYWDFHFLVLILAIVFLYSLVFLLQNKKTIHYENIILIVSISLAALLSYFTIAFLFANAQGPPRYTTPILISTVPALLLFFAKGTNSPSHKKQNVLDSYIFIILLVCHGVSMGLNADSFVYRIKQHSNYRTPVNYTISPSSLDLYKSVIKENSIYKQWIHDVQNLTKKNKSIFTWITEPFYLDYNRNNIISAHPYNIKDKLSDVRDWKTVQDFFIQNNIHYIMWGYNEPLMVTIDNLSRSPRHSGTIKQVQYLIYFIKSLETICQNNKVIYDNGLIKMIQLPQKNNKKS